MSDRLWQETADIAEDYLSLYCSSQRLAPLPPSHTVVAMRHLAERFERQHQTPLYLIGLILWMHRQDPVHSFKRVITMVPGQSRLTWDQVVCIFIIARMVAKDMRTQRGNRKLAEAIADYLANEQQDWLLEHDGWEGFRKFYWDSTTVADHTRLAIVVVYTAMGLALFGLTFLVGRVVFTYLFRALLSLVNW